MKSVQKKYKLLLLLAITLLLFSLLVYTQVRQNSNIVHAANSITVVNDNNEIEVNSIAKNRYTLNSDSNIVFSVKQNHYFLGFRSISGEFNDFTTIPIQYTVDGRQLITIKIIAPENFNGIELAPIIDNKITVYKHSDTTTIKSSSGFRQARVFDVENFTSRLKVSGLTVTIEDTYLSNMQTVLTLPFFTNEQTPVRADFKTTYRIRNSSSLKRGLHFIGGNNILENSKFTILENNRDDGIKVSGANTKLTINNISADSLNDKILLSISLGANVDLNSSTLKTKGSKGIYIKDVSSILNINNSTVCSVMTHLYTDLITVDSATLNILNNSIIESAINQTINKIIIIKAINLATIKVENSTIKASENFAFPGNAINSNNSNIILNNAVLQGADVNEDISNSLIYSNNDASFVISGNSNINTPLNTRISLFSNTNNFSILDANIGSIISHNNLEIKKAVINKSITQKGEGKTVKIAYLSANSDVTIKNNIYLGSGSSLSIYEIKNIINKTSSTNPIGYVIKISPESTTTIIKDSKISLEAVDISASYSVKNWFNGQISIKGAKFSNLSLTTANNNEIYPEFTKENTITFTVSDIEVKYKNEIYTEQLSVPDGDLIEVSANSVNRFLVGFQFRDLNITDSEYKYVQSEHVTVDGKIKVNIKVTSNIDIKAIYLDNNLRWTIKSKQNEPQEPSFLIGMREFKTLKGLLEAISKKGASQLVFEINTPNNIYNLDNSYSYYGSIIAKEVNFISIGNLQRVEVFAKIEALKVDIDTRMILNRDASIKASSNLIIQKGISLNGSTLESTKIDLVNGSELSLGADSKIISQRTCIHSKSILDVGSLSSVEGKVNLINDSTLKISENPYKFEIIGYKSPTAVDVKMLISSSSGIIKGNSSTDALQVVVTDFDFRLIPAFEITNQKYLIRVVDNFNIKNYIVPLAISETTRYTLKTISEPASIEVKVNQEIISNASNHVYSSEVEYTGTNIDYDINFVNQANKDKYTIEHEIKKDNISILRNEIVNLGEYNILVRFIPKNNEINLSYSEVLIRIIIIKKNITINAKDKRISYGSLEGELSYQISNPSVEIVGIELSLPSLDATKQYRDVGLYKISLSSDVHNKNPNYNITYVPANLIVERRSITVFAIGQNVDYGSDELVTLKYNTNIPTNIATHLSGSLQVKGIVFINNQSKVNTLDAGSYRIDVGSINNQNNPNFDIDYISANLIIDKIDITVSIKEVARTLLISEYSAPTNELTYKKGHFSSDNLANNSYIEDIRIGIKTREVGIYDLETLNPNKNFNIQITNLNSFKYQVIKMNAQVYINKDISHKKYGEKDPSGFALGYTSDKNINMQGKLTRSSGETAGTYDIFTADISRKNPNYNIVLATKDGSSINFTIDKLEIKSIDYLIDGVLIDDTKKYNYKGSNYEVSYLIKDENDLVVNSVEYTSNIEKELIKLKNAGVYNIQLQISNNYFLDSNLVKLNQKFTISRIELALSDIETTYEFFNSKSLNVSQTNWVDNKKPLDIDLEGGDIKAILSFTLPSSEVGSYTNIKYKIDLIGEGKDNYILVSSNTGVKNITINPKKIVIKAKDIVLEYETKTANFEYTLLGEVYDEIDVEVVYNPNLNISKMSVGDFEDLTIAYNIKTNPSRYQVITKNGILKMVEKVIQISVKDLVYNGEVQFPIISNTEIAEILTDQTNPKEIKNAGEYSISLRSKNRNYKLSSDILIFKVNPIKTKIEIKDLYLKKDDAMPKFENIDINFKGVLNKDLKEFKKQLKVDLILPEGFHTNKENVKVKANLNIVNNNKNYELDSTAEFSVIVKGKELKQNNIYLTGDIIDPVLAKNSFKVIQIPQSVKNTYENREKKLKLSPLVKVRVKEIIDIVFDRKAFSSKGVSISIKLGKNTSQNIRLAQFLNEKITVKDSSYKIEDRAGEKYLTINNVGEFDSIVLYEAKMSPLAVGIIGGVSGLLLTAIIVTLYILIRKRRK